MRRLGVPAHVHRHQSTGSASTARRRLRRRRSAPRAPSHRSAAARSARRLPSRPARATAARRRRPPRPARRRPCRRSKRRPPRMTAMTDPTGPRRLRHLRASWSGAASLALAIAIVGAVIGGMVAGWIGLVERARSAPRWPWCSSGSPRLSILIANRWFGNDLYVPSSSAIVLGGWLLKFVVFLVLVVVLRDQPWVDPIVLFLSSSWPASSASLVVDWSWCARVAVPYVSDVDPAAWDDERRSACRFGPAATLASVADVPAGHVAE